MTTVLVIDDDASARQTTEAQLLPDGYTLRLAGSGAEGLAAWEHGDVDLVVCDVMMPGLDGFAVCRAIKQATGRPYTPVILLTALDAPDDEVRGIEAGADHFVTKPVDGRVLRARVRTLLGVRRRFRELEAARPEQRRAEVVANARLTVREQEVLELLLLGRGHPEIAQALGITERTSKFHQANLFAKLGVESRQDLLRVFL